MSKQAIVHLKFEECELIPIYGPYSKGYSSQVICRFLERHRISKDNLRAVSSKQKALLSPFNYSTLHFPVPTNMASQTSLILRQGPQNHIIFLRFLISDKNIIDFHLSFFKMAGK